MPCIVDGFDYMEYVKKHVGTKSNVIRTISSSRHDHLSLENRVPEEYGGMHYGGECVWEYEIEGFWSTCECSSVFFTNSGYHHLQYLHWCYLHSDPRVVHLREQTPQGEAQHFVERFSCWTRGGEGTLCVVLYLLAVRFCLTTVM